ncbi:unnamed protein product [Somion occarium]|uniref:G-patch domain-containing protein n=1 Tax=Somion occarium TaxID=3059160 RepID=A0ABP1CP83_9APHY
MSSATIARWNAIPMEGSGNSGPVQSLKRPRDDDDMQDSDDDVLLVSRSPSPVPLNAMDIDKYDEYVRGVEREVITVETKINATNKGFALLSKLGWVEGQPLGISGDGRVDPVPFYVKNDLTGLGKSNQDVRVIESTVSQRRELHSEKLIKESEEQRRAREELVAKRAILQTEISSTLRAFYCELCDKQFQNVAQYDEHTNSYAHHHKARSRDLQLAQRASSTAKEELDKRKEKERKREEKELRKLAKAAGIKMAKPPAVINPPSTPPAAGVENEAKPSGFRKSGWATLGSASSSAQATAPVEPPSSAFRRSGWATVGPASSSSNMAPPPSSPFNQPQTEPPPPPPSGSDFAPPPSGTVNDSQYHSGPAPMFRTGGWSSLDAGSSQLTPNPQPPSPASYESPPLRRADWASTTSSNPSPYQRQRSASSSGWSNPPIQAGLGSLSVQQEKQPPSPSPVQPQQPIIAARPEPTRSGWQQFRAGAPGRRR